MISYLGSQYLRQTLPTYKIPFKRLPGRLSFLFSFYFVPTYEQLFWRHSYKYGVEDITDSAPQRCDRDFHVLLCRRDSWYVATCLS